MNTSRKAYREIKHNGTISRQHIQIINAMQKKRSMSLQEISKASGVSINATCGRVNELKALDSIVKAEKRPCRITGRTIQSLKLN